MVRSLPAARAFFESIVERAEAMLPRYPPDAARHTRARLGLSRRMWRLQPNVHQKRHSLEAILGRLAAVRQRPRPLQMLGGPVVVLVDLSPFASLEQIANVSHARGPSKCPPGSPCSVYRSQISLSSRASIGLVTSALAFSNE